jgi:hypothetical protein
MGLLLRILALVGMWLVLWIALALLSKSTGWEVRFFCGWVSATLLYAVFPRLSVGFRGGHS